MNKKKEKVSFVGEPMTVSELGELLKRAEEIKKSGGDPHKVLGQEALRDKMNEEKSEYEKAREIIAATTPKPWSHVCVPGHEGPEDRGGVGADDGEDACLLHIADARNKDAIFIVLARNSCEVWLDRIEELEESLSREREARIKAVEEMEAMRAQLHQERKDFKESDLRRFARMAELERKKLGLSHDVVSLRRKLEKVEKERFEEGTGNERDLIAQWLRKIDAVSRWGGPESDEIISVTEVMNAIADAIERGEHEVKSDEEVKR